MIRIGFFGTPELASKVLQDLCKEQDIEVVFAVTNPDKKVGRDAIVTESPVKKVANSLHIPVFTPTKIRDNNELFQTLSSFLCEYFIVVAYGRILPNEILEMPREMCINIHGSLLPKYRGASPIQSALLFGEKVTGVTIMQMNEKMDEGDILSSHEILLSKDETSGTLFKKFAEVSGSVLIETLRGLKQGSILPKPQDHKKATYCTKITKEDGLLDWNMSAKELYQKWQAYTPWPGIYTYYEEKRLLLEKVSYIQGYQGSTIPGMVIVLSGGEIGIVCSKGILTLEQVKLEGKKSQNIRDFINGNSSFITYIFTYEKRI